MQFVNFYFRFSLSGTILAILGTTLFSSLGIWQIHRAQEKHEIQNTMDIRQQLEPAQLNNLVSDSNIQKNIYSPVIATGHFDKQHEILIDNEVHKGKAGYHVLTPLKLLGTDKVIMVNRGWIDLGYSRDIIPNIETPTDVINIQATLMPFKSKPALILNKEDMNSGKVWPFFDYESYIASTGYNLLPVVLHMSKESQYGFVREWPQFNAREGMHIGYSIQWFAFAIIVVVTYFGLTIKKKQVN